MYSVSDLYREAMKKPVQTHFLKGTIGDYEFNDENILEGSFSITNQCSGNDSIEIGQVYIGELNATFINMSIERYSWKDKEIKPYFGMKLSDGSIEYIPLGVFTINNAEWTSSGTVIKAYDHMAKLDKNCNKTITEVTPYECVKRIEEETGVEFANKEEDFSSFPNGTIMISETTTNDVETWRDLLSWLAQTICCFATANREGKIEFKQFLQDVTDEVDDKHRFTGASFSDYVTRYTGLSVVNMADTTTNYYGLEVDDGLTMNLGSNPFLQYGVEDTKEAMRKAILEGISKIEYVPFKVKMIGNPAYDLGDVLVFSNGLADGSKKYCITKYVFNYHGTFEITGVGQDPSLSSAKSKTDKNIIGLISNTDENTLVHYQFSNTNVVDVGEDKRETIASIKFATATKDSQVSLWIELLPELTKTYKHSINDTSIKEVTLSNPILIDEVQEEIENSNAAILDLNSRIKTTEKVIANPDKITLTVTYMLNGSIIDYKPIETYAVDGKHILGLHYYIGNVNANTLYTFSVMLEVHNATAFFGTNCINMLVSGMGLAGSGMWDGTIQANEDLIGINHKSIIGNLNDEVNINLENITQFGGNDSVRFDFLNILKGFKDEFNITKVIEYYILSSTEGYPIKDDLYIINNSDKAFVLQTDYSTDGKPIEVDEGYLEKLDIFNDYPEINVLESMEVK